MNPDFEWEPITTYSLPTGVHEVDVPMKTCRTWFNYETKNKNWCANVHTVVRDLIKVTEKDSEVQRTLGLFLNSCEWDTNLVHSNNEKMQLRDIITQDPSDSSKFIGGSRMQFALRRRKGTEKMSFRRRIVCGKTACVASILVIGRANVTSVDDGSVKVELVFDSNFIKNTEI